MQIVEWFKKRWRGDEILSGGQGISTTVPATAKKRGRPTVEIDAAEVVRLHDDCGLSFQKIAKRLGHAASTVLQRYQEQRAHPTAVEPPRAAPEPPASIPARPEPPRETVGLPPAFSAAISSLVAPAPAVKAEPTAIAAEIADEVDTIYGLDSIKPGEPFFLLLDEEAARMAHSCGQRAIALPSWDVDSFAEFPTVRAAPRIYVIVPVRPFDADTARLLRALYASGLRDQIWAAEIRVPLATVFERRRELEDKYGEATGLWFWEQTFHFAPLGDAMRLVPQIAPQPQEPYAVGYVPSTERWPNNGFATRLPRC